MKVLKPPAPSPRAASLYDCGTARIASSAARMMCSQVSRKACDPGSTERASETFTPRENASISSTLALTAYLAVKEFPNELQYKAYTLGASHLEVIWTIIFRQVLPRLIDGVRLMIGPVMVFLIAAEMLVGDVGFGYRIRLQSKLLNMSVVYPYLAMLAAFGFGMDYALQLLQRWWSPWFEKKQG